jgi:hypothetical protein
VLGRLPGARGIRPGLTENRLGLRAHPGRLRLGLGEPVPARRGGAAEQRLGALAVDARLLGELLVVGSGALRGLGLRLGEDVAHRPLCPPEVGLGARDDLGGLRLGVREDGRRLLAGRPQQGLGLGARLLLAGRQLPDPGRDLGLHLPAAAPGIRLALPAEAVQVRDGRGPHGFEVGDMRLLLAVPAGKVGLLLLAEAGHHGLVLHSGRFKHLLGLRACLGEPCLRLLVGDRHRLVVGLGGAGPEQGRLVGGVGEHDLDLGAGLLEPALGLLTGRLHRGSELLELVHGRLQVGTHAHGLGTRLRHLAVGVGAQLVGEVLRAREQGECLVDRPRGGNRARFRRHRRARGPFRHAPHNRMRSGVLRTVSAPGWASR